MDGWGPGGIGAIHKSEFSPKVKTGAMQFFSDGDKI